MPYQRQSDSDRIADSRQKAVLDASQQSLEAAAAKVTDAMIEAFCAIGRDASLKRLQSYRDMGVTMPVLAPIASPRVEDWEAVIELV